MKFIMKKEKYFTMKYAGNFTSWGLNQWAFCLRYLTRFKFKLFLSSDR